MKRHKEDRPIAGGAAVRNLGFDPHTPALDAVQGDLNHFIGAVVGKEWDTREDFLSNQ